MVLWLYAWVRHLIDIALQCTYERLTLDIIRPLIAEKLQQFRVVRILIIGDTALGGGFMSIQPGIELHLIDDCAPLIRHTEPWLAQLCPPQSTCTTRYARNLTEELRRTDAQYDVVCVANHAAHRLASRPDVWSLLQGLTSEDGTLIVLAPRGNQTLDHIENRVRYRDGMLPGRFTLAFRLLAALVRHSRSVQKRELPPVLEASELRRLTGRAVHSHGGLCLVGIWFRTPVVTLA